MYLWLLARYYRTTRALASLLPARVLGFYRKFDRFRRMIFNGASKGLVLRRTGSKWGDCRNYCWVKLMYWLDRLDTCCYYKTKPIQAKFGRVRSSGEKAIANWLWDQNIAFCYEQPVSVAGKRLVPDFFLPVEGVFIEFFGLMSEEKYRQRHDRKMALYRKHRLPIIAIYPHHLGNRLEAELRRQLQGLQQQRLTI